MSVGFPVTALALLLCLIPSASSQAQSLTGHWAATGKILNNGEQQKAIFDLTQNGDQLTGTVRGLGFSTGVKGNVKGSHFELFGVDWNDKTPFLVGDLANGIIDGKQWGDKFTAKPATAADDFPKLPYIDPPALKKVPYNGLAKTPPMGWNSWNLFAEKSTTRQCARWLTQWFRAACEMRAISISISTTRGKAFAMRKGTCLGTTTSPT